MIKIHNCDEGPSVLKISLSENEKKKIKIKKNSLARSPVAGEKCNERQLY
jgi:hypothetical protein